MATDPKKPREDTNTHESKHTGFLGWYERRVRKFRRTILGATLLLLFLLVALLLGTSLAPAIAFISYVFRSTDSFASAPRFICEGISIFLGWWIFGFTAICIVPIANLMALPFLKPFRGSVYSVDVFGWYLHNILTYSLRYSFLDWITPTPFNLFFYKRMGMKVGDRVEINTSNISDPGLITLEDGVTLGGSVSLVAHYAQANYLIISPVVIRKNATIGLRAIIMGGTEIGEGAKVLPNSVVLPKTIIPAGETWAGIPAKKYENGQ